MVYIHNICNIHFCTIHCCFWYYYYWQISLHCRPVSVDGLWVSLTYDLSLNTYFWLDTVETQETTFDYWATSEPDSNPPDSGDIPNICGLVKDSSALKWFMEDCRQLRSYVCEYGKCSFNKHFLFSLYVFLPSKIPFDFYMMFYTTLKCLPFKTITANMF